MGINKKFVRNNKKHNVLRVGRTYSNIMMRKKRMRTIFIANEEIGFLMMENYNNELKGNAKKRAEKKILLYTVNVKKNIYM